jgi:diketogulonate reductase-like aldo/keto reductase
MSTFAFGTYRVTDENLLHIEALKEAIELGVRMIETAPYYTNGGAQRAVKKVMELFEDAVRSEIEIVSKCLLPQERDCDIKSLIDEQIEASL